MAPQARRMAFDGHMSDGAHGVSVTHAVPGGPLNGTASPPNGIRWPSVGLRAVRPHLATPPAPERVRLPSRRRTAHGGERSVGRLVIVARSGSRGWRLGFGIRAGRRRTRALPTRAAAQSLHQARPPALQCVRLPEVRTAEHAAWRAA
eukprot:scaffold20444_cov71-Phaeocystis_antarctica.AAC.5